MWPNRTSAILTISACLTMTACLDYGLRGDGDDPPPTDDDDDTTEVPPVPQECDPDNWPAEEVGPADDACVPEPDDGFTPIVEWSYDPGGCLSVPVVGDLDGNGQPDIVLNITNILSAAGELVVLRGDGSTLWEDPDASLGYAASPALGDLDGDGSPEVVVVREYATSMWGGAGDYTVVAYGGTGAQLWESEHFQGFQVNYETSPSISDMDHDGSAEVVVGRVILDATGATRATSADGGTGSFMVPAVTDLDLDGVEEVIGGVAWYALDGQVLWTNPVQSAWGGLVAVANLDDDPEGEVVVTMGEEVHVYDTDGTAFWATPLTLQAGQLVSAPAIGELDGDPYPEIVVAGGSQLYCLNHDGTVRWTAPVTDETGATGATIFDFEGDGIPEVAYVDEVSILVFDGTTGTLKYSNSEHSSNTMWEYAVIADVDADDHAEIAVCHNGLSHPSMTVFGAQNDGWEPARPVWNQHAYGISNVGDDLSIPTEAVPSFADSNTWHSALADTWNGVGVDLWLEILEVCCEEDVGYVTVRVLNRGYEALEDDVSVALYAHVDDDMELVATGVVTGGIAAGWTSEALDLYVPAETLRQAVRMSAVADDDGTGAGVVAECSEGNNWDEFWGPLCE